MNHKCSVIRTFNMLTSVYGRSRYLICVLIVGQAVRVLSFPVLIFLVAAVADDVRLDTEERQFLLERLQTFLHMHSTTAIHTSITVYCLALTTATLHYCCACHDANRCTVKQINQLTRLWRYVIAICCRDDTILIKNFHLLYATKLTQDFTDKCLQRIKFFCQNRNISILNVIFTKQRKTSISVLLGI